MDTSSFVYLFTAFCFFMLRFQIIIPTIPMSIMIPTVSENVL